MLYEVRIPQKEYTSSAADGTRRNEEGGGSDVIGNVDSGSSDQQESSVQVTPVESAFDSQDGPS